MKRLLSIILVTVMGLTLIPISFANGNATVNKDTIAFGEGQETVLSSNAFLYETNKEYLYVPIEDVANEFGLILGWDGEKGAEICIVGEKKYLIFSDRNEVESDGKNLWFDSPALMYKGRLYISDEHILDFTGRELVVGDNVPQYKRITVIGKSKDIFVNGTRLQMASEPYMSGDNVFVPLDSIMALSGFALGWDNTRGATVCYRDGKYSYVTLNEGKTEISGTIKTYNHKPFIKNNMAYISDEMFRDLTGYDIIPYGEIRGMGGRDSIMDSTRTDAYRLSGNVNRGGGVTVVGTFAMELVSASDTDSRNYAGVINAMAESVPDCNVYNIVVPTSAEFYAPAGMYPNQLRSIQTVYSNLSDKVTPINVYDILKEHAGEKLYFSTDHHWTQRGAYYAYSAFIEEKGGTIDDLSTFTNVPSYNMVGSFANFARGTVAGNIVKSNPELLERFLPKYATVGTVYSDGLAQRKSYTVNAVNTANNSYSCFIGGDGPVTIFHTDAPGNETVLIVKESFGNAFATWAMHNYKKVCVVDPRKFNGFGGNYNYFNLKSFCDAQGVDDIIFINYPVAVGSSGIRGAILNMR